MGFTRDYESIKEKFQGYAPEVVYRFWNPSVKDT
jgi:hypothetical protein